MRLGIDIDGVLADALTTWLEHLNRHFDQKKARKDMVHYQFEKVFSVSWEEMDGFFRSNQEILLTNISPMEKAQETMEQLAGEHEILLITARPQEYRSITEKWLNEHSIPYHELIMTDFLDKSGHCLNCGLDLFIEDSLENAISIHACGIPVLLFDAPYNKAPLPKGIIRQYSWREISHTVKEFNKGNDKLIMGKLAGK